MIVFSAFYARKNNEDFERLLFHTEVIWISKGACLIRFYVLYDTVAEFFEDTMRDKQKADKLITVKNDVVYISKFTIFVNPVESPNDGSVHGLFTI